MTDQKHIGPLAQSLDRAIASFDRDPPDTDFQRGYMEALKYARSEQARLAEAA